ncbi:MAG TPA: DUF86 domain-containing protein [Fervidobacterium sp.]|jgi:uncharacterized protein YutE (UPF0331/DUF86 family)|nr:DUF86 domain-containing protein [Syntrophomonadaceae bacterium]HUM44857.1 DUF86 domain-containing protein [Fervidobacterium sp.]
MSDHERICAKLNKVQNYYDELKSLSSISLDEYLGNSIYRRAVERTLQLIVESATDINNMLLKMLGQKGAVDYYNSFINLAEQDIIPMDFALKIAPSTGLRNILVHEYEEIDDKVVYNSINPCLQYYLEYMDLINRYLKCNW